jgi:hypothetical protein
MQRDAAPWPKELNLFPRELHTLLMPILLRTLA